ncbi:hypothetical protein [Candidatus Nitrosacidococcus tergens]|uniref:Uncharacterized protein n=1 Tax=Candidatus Nitrosacidococcus tergens TaxID=553981 RepID=A0A7G1Q8X5_9GAMM|nr:hypothetical protein [Candidatus Nitrosacidococcus tergens]CAB1275315.1 conserved protein of unknown function [Candidatus Nitrosacidococcus tergens]
MLLSKNKKQVICKICLSAYLVGWLVSAQVLPLFIATLGYSHQLFVTQQNNQLEIFLHHPGHYDQHELASSSINLEQDLLDKLIYLLTDENKQENPDHIFYIPLDKLPSLEADEISDSKPIKVIAIFFASIISLVFITYSSRYLSTSSFRKKSLEIPLIPMHLATTVLQI